jgi:hypothetical protein
VVVFFQPGSCYGKVALTIRSLSDLIPLLSLLLQEWRYPGFGLLLLGFAHLLNRFGLAGLLILEAAFFRVLKRDNWLSLIFWRRIVQDFVKGWTFPALFIYVLFLALGLPAILPPIGGEPVSYHLAYAADWANAGRIYVDPFLRFPYYANNFLLFDSAFFILKLGDYCHFLTWLCGLLTCLGVLAFFAPAELHSTNDPQRRRLFPFLHPFLIPLSLALSPVFLKHLNGGYVDTSGTCRKLMILLRRYLICCPIIRIPFSRKPTLL